MGGLLRFRAALYVQNEKLLCNFGKQTSSFFIREITNAEHTLKKKHRE